MHVSRPGLDSAQAASFFRRRGAYLGTAVHSHVGGPRHRLRHRRQGQGGCIEHERGDPFSGAAGPSEHEAEGEGNPAIFREYDIRGLAEQDFDKEFALQLGKVHGTMIAAKGGTRVSVGRDCRATSDPYAEAVIEGLASAGIQVYDIGVCPTPLLYFSLFHLDVDGGIEVTASHNPSEYNGFKLCVGKDTLYGQQIQEIRAKMERGEFREKPGGKVERYEIVPPYHVYLMRAVPKLVRPLKVVVDAGSGGGGPGAPPLFRQIGR